MRWRQLWLTSHHAALWRLAPRAVEACRHPPPAFGGAPGHYPERPLAGARRVDESVVTCPARG
eukprot:12316368-Alexandrium_andersonii.AAC.1